MSQLNSSNSLPVSDDLSIEFFDADGIVLVSDANETRTTYLADEVLPLINALTAALYRVEALRLEAGLESLLDPTHKIIFDVRQYMRQSGSQPENIFIGLIKAVRNVTHPAMDLGDCKRFVETHWEALTAS